MAYDLIIRGAQLRGLPQLMDIGISEGRIASLSQTLVCRRD